MTATTAQTIAERDFARKTVKALAKLGITLVSAQLVAGEYGGTTVYTVNDNGTSRVRNHSEVLALVSMVIVNVDGLGKVAKMSSLPLSAQTTANAWFSANEHSNHGYQLCVMQNSECASGYDVRSFAPAGLKFATRQGWVLIARGL